MGRRRPTYLFCRHDHASGLHSIWRMDADGANQVELVGGPNQNLFHPNLHSNKKLVLYTKSDTSGRGQEIWVYNQATKDNKPLYRPKWPVAGAIWHPDGSRAVVAENPAGNNYRLIVISYPGGLPIQTLTDAVNDNSIPYYAYPSGAAIDWIRWPGGRRTRNVAWMRADGSGSTLLTNDAYENTKILGELEIKEAGATASNSGRKVCIPRIVGCVSSPPPCLRALLPGNIKTDAERLGRFSAGSSGPQRQQLSGSDYVEFMRKDIQAFVERRGHNEDEELRKTALVLHEFLQKADGDARERVAEIYVNSYLAENANGIKSNK